MKQMTRVQCLLVLFIYLILYYTVKLDSICFSCNFTGRNNLASVDVTQMLTFLRREKGRDPGNEFWYNVRETYEHGETQSYNFR